MTSAENFTQSAKYLSFINILLEPVNLTRIIQQSDLRE